MLVKVAALQQYNIQQVISHFWLSVLRGRDSMAKLYLQVRGRFAESRVGDGGADETKLTVGLAAHDKPAKRKRDPK
jgi:hypothetical protein